MQHDASQFAQPPRLLPEATRQVLLKIYLRAIELGRQEDVEAQVLMENQAEHMEGDQNFNDEPIKLGTSGQAGTAA
jgi:hypothetical protein